MPEIFEKKLPRRTLLVGAGAMGAGLLSHRVFAAAARPQNLIDFHHHTVPRNFSLPGKPGNNQTATGAQRNTIEAHLADMDAAGVSKSILSSGSNALFKNPATLLKDVRLVNDDMAEAVSGHPKRFGMFATLPLPDVDASLKEIAYGLDTLKADGVHLFTSYDSTKFLGDPAFDPVFEELNRRHAVVKTHPVANACCNFQGFDSDLASVIELSNDNVRAIAKVLLSGTASRYPNIRWIWSHAGGSLLGSLQRFVGAYNDEPRLKQVLPNGPDYELKRFYYDVAQAYNPITLIALKRMVGASKILFGTDYPVRTPAETWDGVVKSGVFDAKELQEIGSGNATALLRG